MEAANIKIPQNVRREHHVTPELVFCEMSFINTISKELCNKAEMSLEQSLMWNTFFLFLLNARICLDISRDKFLDIVRGEETTDSIVLNRLRDANISMGTLIRTNAFNGSIKEILEERFCNLQSKMYSSWFFTSLTTEECLELQRQYGVFVLNKELIEDRELFETLFHTNVRAITSQTEDNPEEWNFLKQYDHSSNSLVLVDRYILSKEHFLDNLSPVLKAFLPKQKMKIPFHISIIVNKRKDEEDDGVLKEEANAILASIKEELSTICDYPEMIKISICYVPKIYHDRTLLTNEMYLNICRGFDFVFRDEDSRSMYKGRTTAFSFFPCTVQESGAKREYKELLKSLRDIVDHPKTIIVGDEDLNRMLA